VAKQKSVSEIAQELWELLRAYALQETVDPLKKLGAYVAWGAGGSALMSLGAFFLSMSLLRALQTETGDTFVGEYSWVPYFIVALVLCGVTAIAVRRIVRYQDREHRKPA
jgi:FtsH-binding integral membrane protein